ncbi:hypothetical protein [Myroides odoratus]|uniref:hypothetical protein n=1 Tax=Myroides odoratus TaxID=256 RepID=UPI0039AEB14D
MYFLLFSHNVIVSGKEKSAIYDLQHARILYIPNVFVAILEELKTNPIDLVKKTKFSNNSFLLDAYLKKLVDNRMGHFVNQIEDFPELDFEYYFPGTIHSALLETNLKNYNIFKVIDTLDLLGCRHVELRLNISIINIETLKNALSIWENNLLQSIDLYLEHEKSISKEIILELYRTFNKINSIVIVNSPIDALLQEKQICLQKCSLVVLDEKGLKNKKLILDLRYYSESLKYNTNYNNKVRIDIEGNIKNTLFDQRIYGNVKSDVLLDIIESEEFQQFWRITVDNIEELKDSPLRHAIFSPNAMEKREGKYYLI